MFVLTIRPLGLLIAQQCTCRRQVPKPAYGWYNKLRGFPLGVSIKIMTTDCKFEEEWSLDTDIPWRLKGRTKLNKVIKKYNKWLIKGRPEKKRQKLLMRIECGIQTFGQTDGGGDWLEALDRMKACVEQC